MNRPAPARAPRFARTAQAVIAAVTVAALTVLVAPSPASAVSAESLEYRDNLTQSLAPTFTTVPTSVPQVESVLGRGSQLAAGANTILLRAPDTDAASRATGVLARITVLEPDAEIELSVPGEAGAQTAVLSAPTGATASTALLLPVSFDADTGASSITLIANTASHVRVEPLAYVRGDERAPGSTTALAETARRADTSQSLGAAALSAEAFWFGLTGEGGVPAESVRSVYVALDLTLDSPNTLHLSDGQDIALPAGRSVFTTVIAPDEQGGTSVSLSHPGSGQLIADITGWVAEAPAHSTSVNRTGSYVGNTDLDELTVTVSSTRGATDLTLSSNTDVDYALVLVSGKSTAPQAQPTSVLQWSEQSTGRAQGIAVSGPQGVAPQLAFVPLTAGTADLSIRQGGANLVIRPLGGFLGDAPNTANPDATISIDTLSIAGETFPAVDGFEVDISQTGYFTIQGTAIDGASAIDRIELSSPGHGFIGTAALDYDGDRLNWEFDAAAPEDGEFTYVATLFDRGAPQKARATAEITLNVDTHEETEEVVAPNVRHFNQGQDTDFTISETDPREITFTRNPELLPNDLVISGSTPSTPAGFLGAVVSINVLGEVWVVNTREPGIEELIFQADIDETLDYENGAGVELTQAADTVDTPAELYELESTFMEPVPEEITEPISPEITIDEESHRLAGDQTQLITGTDQVDLTFDADNVPDWYDDSTSGPVEFACADPSQSTQEPQGADIDDDGTWVAPSGNGTATPDCSQLQGVTIDKSWSLKTEAKFLFQMKNGKLDLEDQTRMTREEIDRAARGAFDKKVGLSIQIESEVLPHLLFKLDVKLKKKLGFVPTGVAVNDFRVEQKNYVRAQGSLSAFIALEWRFNLVKKLAHIQLPTVTFMAGPVPIVIANKLEIGMSINAGLKAQVTLPLFGMSRDDNFGFTYASDRSLQRIRNTGTVQYSEPNPEPLYTGGKAELSGWITAGPSLEFASQIYGFAGPTVEFKAGPGIEASISTADQNRLNVKFYIGLELSGGAKLTILRWNLLNIKVFELKWQLVLFEREKVLSGQTPGLQQSEI